MKHTDLEYVGWIPAGVGFIALSAALHFYVMPQFITGRPVKPSWSASSQYEGHS